MSRLYDRILAFGCEPAKQRLMLWPDWYEEELRQAGESFGFDRQEAVGILDGLYGIAATSLNPEDLRGAPVIVADEVGEYLHRLHGDEGGLVDNDDVTLAPPFDRLFIEAQGVPSPQEFSAWGLLVRQATHDDVGLQDQDWFADAGWVVALDLVVEPRKNEPMGPVLTMACPLDANGKLLTMSGEDEPKVILGYPDPAPVRGIVMAPGQQEEWDDWIVRKRAAWKNDIYVACQRLLATGLMSIALMHCRNVDSETVEPESGSARSWARKRGQPLTRYERLRIEPMREILDREGEAQSRGIKHALHVCRGHFKTFTEGAPLFGRVTGTFWWADQVRGDRKLGEVVKDYEMSLDTGLGRPYEQADEKPELARREHTGPDPDRTPSASLDDIA